MTGYQTTSVRIELAKLFLEGLSWSSDGPGSSLQHSRATMSHHAENLEKGTQALIGGSGFGKLKDQRIQTRVKLGARLLSRLLAILEAATDLLFNDLGLLDGGSVGNNICGQV
jgi:hypothetical protein